MIEGVATTAMGDIPTAVLTTRLVRTPDLRPLERGEPIAAMYVSSRGGGIRRLIGSAHRHVVAMRRDPQVGYGQPVEGVVESPALMRCATDPNIPWYQTQPFRLELMVGRSLQSYIADLIYVTHDGVVWVREIKRTGADLTKPEYLAKLEAVRRLLGMLGWTFRTWTRKDILGTGARQVNSGRIYYDRSADLEDLLPRFERIASEVTDMTFGELVHVLDPSNPNRARAAVHRLIMRGRVWADLDQLLEDWSDVRLRPAIGMPKVPYA